MRQVIIYQNPDNTISITYPNPRSSKTLEEIAEMSTPEGRPWMIIDESVLPADWEFSAAWTADFSLPGGLGKQKQVGDNA